MSVCLHIAVRSKQFNNILHIPYVYGVLKAITWFSFSTLNAIFNDFQIV